MSLEEMLSTIGSQREIVSDKLVPADYPDCPKDWKKPFRYLSAPKSGEELLPNSDIWIQFMMQKYHAALSRIIGVVNERKRPHIPYGAYIISVALENAFYHGNQNNPELAVNVNVFEGQRGLVISIEDSGQGFDHKSITDLFKGLHYTRIRPQERYFLRKGNGFQAYHIAGQKIAFEKDGRIVNILYEW